MGSGRRVPRFNTHAAMSLPPRIYTTKWIFASERGGHYPHV